MSQHKHNTRGSLNTSGLITFCLTSDCLTPALQSVCHPLSLPATPTITACPSPTSPPATQHSAQLQRRSTLWLWNKPNMAATPPTLSNDQINLIEAEVCHYNNCQLLLSVRMVILHMAAIYIFILTAPSAVGLLPTLTLFSLPSRCSLHVLWCTSGMRGRLLQRKSMGTKNSYLIALSWERVLYL